MTNTITKERRDAIRAILSTNPDSYFKELTLALLDVLDAAEARAAQADHAAACLADMVKDLQAAAEATGTAPEPVAWTSADNLDLMAYRGADQPYEARMWSEPTPDHGVSLYRRPPAAEPVIPEGWVLVPHEPTQEQAEAGCVAHAKRFPDEAISDISAAEIYRAMLAKVGRK